MLKTIANATNSLLDTVSGQSNQYSATKELKKTQEVQKMYSDAINTQYAAGIQNLQNQDKTLALQYDPQRALVNSNYERGVGNNEEQMANLGLTRSGTNLTSQLALETERQRGLAEVNASQDAKRRELQAQSNEYIAQRDSAIAQQSASIYQNAYDNISEYQRQIAQMEKQHSYDKEMAADSYAHDKEMAAISNQYNRDMAALEYEHSLALANNNYDRQLQIEKEMAALNQQYKIETLNRQAEIDKQLLNTEYSLKNSSYKAQAQTDWEYAQKSQKQENSSGGLFVPTSEYAISLAETAAAMGGYDATKKTWNDKTVKEKFVEKLVSGVENNEIPYETFVYFVDIYGLGDLAD